MKKFEIKRTPNYVAEITALESEYRYTEDVHNAFIKSEAGKTYADLPFDKKYNAKENTWTLRYYVECTEEVTEVATDITKLCCDIAEISAKLAQVGYADAEILNKDFDSLDWEHIDLDTSKLFKVLMKIKESNIFDYVPNE